MSNAIPVAVSVACWVVAIAALVVILCVPTTDKIQAPTADVACRQPGYCAPATATDTADVPVLYGEGFYR